MYIRFTVADVRCAEVEIGNEHSYLFRIYPRREECAPSRALTILTMAHDVVQWLARDAEFNGTTETVPVIDFLGHFPNLTLPGEHTEEVSNVILSNTSPNNYGIGVSYTYG